MNLPDQPSVMAFIISSPEATHTSVSSSPSPEAMQTPDSRRFCIFAVDTGLTHSPGLPVELRLKIYMFAFPEMDRSILNERTGDIPRPHLIEIGTEYYYDTTPGRLDYEFINHNGCIIKVLQPERNWRPRRRLRSCLTSNFARDPSIRREFLTEYLKNVQFHWQHRWQQPFFTKNDGLFQFLSMLAATNLNGALGHLTIATCWNQGRSSLPFSEGEVAWLVRIFSTLQYYDIKCELTFTKTPQTLLPVLDRIVEIVKAKFLHSYRDEHPEHTLHCVYPPIADQETLKPFLEDNLLRTLKKDLIIKNLTLRDRPWPTLKYLVDFSK